MKPEPEKCGYCGACVSVCPHSRLELKHNQVKLEKECVNCGNCVIVCPLGALKLEDEA